MTIKQSIDYFAKKWQISVQSSLNIYFNKKFERVVIHKDSIGYGPAYMARQIEGYLCIEINTLNYILELPITGDLATRVKDILNLNIKAGYDKSQVKEIESTIEDVLDLVCDDISVSEAFSLISKNGEVAK